MEENNYPTTHITLKELSDDIRDSEYFLDIADRLFDLEKLFRKYLVSQLEVDYLKSRFSWFEEELEVLEDKFNKILKKEKLKKGRKKNGI